MRPKILLTKELVQEAISATNSISEAAKVAGVPYQTFWRRANEFGLGTACNQGLKGQKKPWTENHYKASAERQKKRLGEKLEKALYYQQCGFNLASVIERVRGYELLVKHGMYSIHTNPGGVVRDHRYPVSKGFKNKVDPKIISHPANCEFLLHRDNASKSLKQSVSLEDLMKEIEAW